MYIRYIECVAFVWLLCDRNSFIFSLENWRKTFFVLMWVEGVALLLPLCDEMKYIKKRKQEKELTIEFSSLYFHKLSVNDFTMAVWIATHKFQCNSFFLFVLYYSVWFEMPQQMWKMLLLLCCILSRSSGQMVSNTWMQFSWYRGSSVFILNRESNRFHVTTHSSRAISIMGGRVVWQEFNIYNFYSTKMSKRREKWQELQFKL